MASCTLVNLAKALSKDIELKIPISRATASRNRQLVSDILVAVIKKETGLKGFLHDVKVVEGLDWRVTRSNVVGKKASPLLSSPEFETPARAGFLISHTLV